MSLLSKWLFLNGFLNPLLVRGFSFWTSKKFSITSKKKLYLALKKIDLKTSHFFLLIMIMFTSTMLSFTQPIYKKKITDLEFRYEFFTTTKAVEAKTDRFYFWFKAGAIHSSEFGVSGELLHGAFEKFYLNNQLAEKGKFKNGLKEGLWKTWFQ
jgi:antitoxin component YwqK of YwqJK toxin-antitoxin module